MLEQTHPYSSRRIAVSGRLDVKPAQDMARFVLRFAPENLTQAEEVLGAKIPSRIGQLIKTDSSFVACIGPDEFYLLVEEGKGQDVVAAFSKLYESQPHSLVEVSHRETGIDVTGNSAEWLLNAALPLDLSEMAAPGCVRTIFDRVQIILMKLDENNYRIEVWNSFADHVWNLLEAASNEVALGV